MDRLNRETLEEELREALSYLHDPYRLRHSPLALRFGVANRHDTPSALRRILTEAIQALEPPTGTPDDSRAWRMYESLYYRYVEQLSHNEVADQMGLSTRQVRREQRAALEALSYQLWDRARMGVGPAHPNSGEADLAEGTDDRGQADLVGTEVTRAVPAGTGAGRLEDSLSQEAAWLQESPPGMVSDVGQVLPAVVALARPLAEGRGVTLAAEPVEESLATTVEAVALRQILLQVLALAVVQSPAQGLVQVSTRREEGDVVVQVTTEPSRTTESPFPPGEDIAAKRRLLEQLAQICGCGLRIGAERGRFVAEVRLGGAAPIQVLVVDDNLGTVQLVQRYLQGTRYVPQAIVDPAEVTPAAVALKPAVILLDVMMPQIDGWEVLGRLREHPETRDIPIIVCTILAQQELALALGAAAFLPKPFTRQALLEALKQQVE